MSRTRNTEVQSELLGMFLTFHTVNYVSTFITILQRYSKNIYINFLMFFFVFYKT